MNAFVKFFVAAMVMKVLVLAAFAVSAGVPPQLPQDAPVVERACKGPTGLPVPCKPKKPLY